MKVVLFTQRVEVVESYGERRDCADQNIALFIRKCGYTPIPLSNTASEDELSELITLLKPAGIILTGGNSLVKYGGSAGERDLTDRRLIQEALNRYIPLYGFCRGMQSILEFFHCQLTDVAGHVAIRHLVTGTVQEVVNSFHNQAVLVKDIREPFIALACTEDGVVEYMKHSQYPIIGTMWHPEREQPFRAEDIDRVRLLFGDGKEI